MVVKNGTDLLTCGNCSLNFSVDDFKGFIEHKRTQCDMDDSACLQCSLCDKRYTSGYALLRHAQTAHAISLFSVQSRQVVTPSLSFVTDTSKQVNHMDLEASQHNLLLQHPSQYPPQNPPHPQQQISRGVSSDFQSPIAATSVPGQRSQAIASSAAGPLAAAAAVAPPLAADECCDRTECGVSVVPITHETIKSCCWSVVPSRRKRHMTTEHLSAPDDMSGEQNDGEAPPPLPPRDYIDYDPTTNPFDDPLTTPTGDSAHHIVNSAEQSMYHQSMKSHLLQPSKQLQPEQQQHHHQQGPAHQQHHLQHQAPLQPSPHNQISMLPPHGHLHNVSLVGLQTAPNPMVATPMVPNSPLVHMLTPPLHAATPPLHVATPPPNPPQRLLVEHPLPGSTQHYRGAPTPIPTSNPVFPALVTSTTVSHDMLPLEDGQPRLTVGPMTPLQLVTDLPSVTSMVPVSTSMCSAGPCDRNTEPRLGEPQHSAQTHHQAQHQHQVAAALDDMLFCCDFQSTSTRPNNVPVPDPGDLQNSQNKKTVTFARRNKRHRKYPTSRPFNCTFCSKSFNQRIHLKKHEISKHDGEKPYKCDKCDYSTVERSHLRVHDRVHTGEKPFKCSLCSYATTQNCTLMMHLKRHHSQVAPKLSEITPTISMISHQTPYSSGLPTNSILKQPQQEAYGDLSNTICEFTATVPSKPTLYNNSSAHQYHIH